MSDKSLSSALFRRAQAVLPGGVSSPVRAFGAVGGTPPFIQSGRGARLTDVDGNEYIDFVMSWGPLIHGHSHPDIVSLVNSHMARGTSFGAPTEAEIDLAEAIRDCLPSVEMLRFVSSGTEAAMSAIRLARGFTGRDLIVKFDGCYHGHADGLLVRAGSGAATFGEPTSAGVPAGVAALTAVLPFNDCDGFEQFMTREGSRVAAVLVEPVAGNMGTVPPEPGFLLALRSLTELHGALLIFDEVITGFRLGSGGAQERYRVTPDLTCLGKIIGGGLPAAAFGGRGEIMNLLSPIGPVYQAGTLSGNPLAMCAGLASIRLCREANYADLEGMASTLAAGLTKAAQAADVHVTVNLAGPMLSLFFNPGPVRDMATAGSSNASAYAAFFQAMLEQGVYLPPSQFETWMLSFAHTREDMDFVVRAADYAFRNVVEETTGHALAS